ncbi:SDR family oxidoreductase [Paenibacillus durus]|uniref:Short-chain dehydrogenase n=1 Tax=Paenibacillus durus ATCC 35681 TaxID=1333534 RepID=A0A0F7FEG8_PAEDU|nr:SDR family oxidoreductase [Paenibacillus durus]AKG37292.1 short-chain dehydrogenase [Paenibacillus durus ATCC 35681]
MANNVVVITGASSGIGKETAKYFAEKGWTVAATMRTPDKETELTEIENVKIYPLDVTDFESIESAKNAIINDFGKVDVVLNNAGYGLMGAFELANYEQIKRQYDVNVFGLFAVTKAFLPHFRENKKGLFINISSVAGKTTFPYLSMYHSTKWAVEGFTESLGFELGRLGIKAKLVEPGGVATDFSGRSLVITASETVEDYNEDFDTFQQAIQSMLIESEPIVIAKVIYEAATDGKDQVRYIAGEDAVQAIGARAQMGDEAFIKMVKERSFSK